MFEYSYDEFLRKENKYKRMQVVLDGIKSTILSFAEDEKITARITEVVGESGVLNIDYFDRTIKIILKNNFNSGLIKFDASIIPPDAAPAPIIV